MSRPVIQLHTIEQWLTVDLTVQTMVLNNIKLRERLWRWLMARELNKTEVAEGWVPCKSCETRGWMPLRPRRPGSR